MEKNITQNVMPEVRVVTCDPLDKLVKVLHFIFDHFHVPEEPKRGAAELLDRSLYGETQDSQ